VTADAPHVGSVLRDRYELVRHIGSAELSEIYEAEDQVLHRRVAVRISTAASPEDRARFDAEARSLARVNEPDVASVYDAGQHGDVTFVVLQLVAGAEDEPTAPIAAVDPSGDITRVIGGADHTQVLPAMVPLIDPAPVAARRRDVPVWGMVAGLAAVLVAVLAFIATRGPDNPGQVPAVASTSTTTVTTVAVRTRAPVTTATTAPTTTEPTTTTTVEPTTTSITMPPLPAAGPNPGQAQQPSDPGAQG
jgi:hypothetical protein